MDFLIFYNENVDAKKDFQELFGIDLDNPKYEFFTDIEQKWEAVIADIYKSNDRYGINECYLQFRGAIFQLFENCYSRIVRTYEDDHKRQNEAEKHFRSLVQRLTMEVEKYPIYEPDIWINALVSMEYYDLYQQRESIKKVTKDSKGICVPDEYGNVLHKKQEFMVPFGILEEWQFAFLGKYGQKMMGQNILTFATEYRDGESEVIKDGDTVSNFSGYEKRVEFKFIKDKRYERWSEKKISYIEEELSSSLKDQILFQKTVNGLLCHNMVNNMIELGGDYQVEDFCYLIKCVASCKSLSWQNLIGCLFVCISHWKTELGVRGVLDPAYSLIFTWINNIDRINNYTTCLSNGLVYLLQKYDKEKIKPTLQKRAKKSLDVIKNLMCLPDVKMENGRKKFLNNVWRKQPVTLRMTMEVANRHTEFWWIYAMLQRYIIESTKSLCNITQKK